MIAPTLLTPMATVPALIVEPPVKVLAPLSVSVPAPVLVSTPVPVNAPIFPEICKSTAAEPLSMLNVLALLPTSVIGAVIKAVPLAAL